MPQDERDNYMVIEIMRSKLEEIFLLLTEMRKTLGSMHQNIDLLMVFLYDAISELKRNSGQTDSNKKSN